MAKHDRIFRRGYITRRYTLPNGYETGLFGIFCPWCGQLLDNEKDDTVPGMTSWVCVDCASVVQHISGERHMLAIRYLRAPDWWRAMPHVQQAASSRASAARSLRSRRR